MIFFLFRNWHFLFELKKNNIPKDLIDKIEQKQQKTEKRRNDIHI